MAIVWIFAATLGGNVFLQIMYPNPPFWVWKTFSGTSALFWYFNWRMLWNELTHCDQQPFSQWFTTFTGWCVIVASLKKKKKKTAGLVTLSLYNCTCPLITWRRPGGPVVVSRRGMFHTHMLSALDSVCVCARACARVCMCTWQGCIFSTHPHRSAGTRPRLVSWTLYRFDLSWVREHSLLMNASS